MTSWELSLCMAEQLRNFLIENASRISIPIVDNSNFKVLDRLLQYRRRDNKTKKKFKDTKKENVSWGDKESDDKTVKKFEDTKKRISPRVKDESKKSLSDDWLSQPPKDETEKLLFDDYKEIKSFCLEYASQQWEIESNYHGGESMYLADCRLSQNHQYINITDSDNTFFEQEDNCDDLSEKYDQSSLKVSDLLHNNKRVVVVFGKAGMGKTVLCKSLLRDFAQKKSEFELLFYIQLCHVDSRENCNLLTLLARSCNSECMYLKNRRVNLLKKIATIDKVCIVLDGLDQINIDDRSIENDVSFDNDYSVETLINALVRDKPLLKSKIIVTSRPREFDQMPSFVQQTPILNILGLQTPSQTTLCKKIYKQKYSKIMGVIQSDSDLIHFCKVPLHFIFVMHVVNDFLSEDEKHPTMPRLTITNIVAATLMLLLHHHKIKSKKNQIIRLANLAWLGYSKKQLFFEYQNLKDLHISGSTIDSLLLATSYNDPSSHHLKFSLHKLFQNFFLALHLVLQREIAFEETLNTFIEQNCFFSSLFFVAGFVNDYTNKYLQELVPKQQLQEKRKSNDIDEQLNILKMKHGSSLSNVHINRLNSERKTEKDSSDDVTRRFGTGDDKTVEYFEDAMKVADHVTQEFGISDDKTVEHFEDAMKERILSNDQPSTSATNVVNFSNASIISSNDPAGVGYNINKNPTSPTGPPPTKPLKYDIELRKLLKENAERNCLIEGVSYLQTDKRRVKYVPLQLTEYNVKDESFLKEEEDQQIKDLQPSGDLKLENLFQKSQEFSKSTSKYKAAASKKAKEDCLNQLSRTVGIIAHAGMGKTCLAKQALKLVVDRKFKADYIFYLKFRDIDYQSETNLLSFLIGDHRYEAFDQQMVFEIIKRISENKNTFLVLDGLDQSMLTFYTESDVNVHGKAKAETFLLKLFSGDIFPHAKILLTSRPFQLLNMPKEYRPSYIVQLTGISKSSQRSICKDICGASASVIFFYIQSYTKFACLCVVPQICIAIMYCLFKTHQFNQNSNLPITLTEIFLLLILLYLLDETHVRGSVNLKNLCTLAWNGISNRKFIFDKSDMREAGLENIVKNDFTITIEYEVGRKRLEPITPDMSQFTHFSHTIIQEFFAAMHVVFFEENVKELEKLFSHDHDLYLHETNYDMFALFIFGLCNESTFLQYFSHDHFMDFNRDLYNQKVMMTKQYLQTIRPTYYGDSFLTDSSLKTMDWLYQFNDVALTVKFTNSLKNRICISTRRTPPNYILPYNYILRHRSEEIMFDRVRCYDGCGGFVEEFGRTLDENHNVKLRKLFLWTKLTAENVSSFEICLQKVEERIEVCRGFESLKAAKKFKNFIMERETPLKHLQCYDVHQWHDFSIRSTLTICQEKVENQIDFY